MEGQRFNKLTVLRRSSRTNAHYGKYWIVQCDCGLIKDVQQQALKSGATGTCGRKGCKSTMKPKHGMYLSITYVSWGAMRQRCENPKATAYHKYGAKGITVCARWFKFENFLADMGERPSKDFSLERIDSRKNYTPKNCRWASREEQQANIRHNVNVTHQGMTKNLSQWARWAGMPSCTLSHRLLKGMTFEQAIIPAKSKPKQNVWVTYRGRTMTRTEWARELGIHSQTLAARLANWSSMDKIMTPGTVKRGFGHE